MSTNIDQIEELEKAVANGRISLLKPKTAVCIYYPEVSCSAPKMKFKICLTCPRCMSVPLPKGNLGALFNYIKMFAIFLMNMMGGQASK